MYWDFMDFSWWFMKNGKSPANGLIVGDWLGFFLKAFFGKPPLGMKFTWEFRQNADPSHHPHPIWLVVDPLKNMEAVGMMTFPIYYEK